jgi:hypothetical protein
VNARRVVVLVLDIVLLAAVVGFFVWQSSRSDAGSSGASTESEQARVEGSTAAGKRKQAREVRRALLKLARNPDALVADASRSKVGKRARRAVPRGSKVTPVQRTWSPDGTGGGTMTVKIKAPGKRQVAYAAVMVREAGGWKVLATIPVANP